MFVYLLCFAKHLHKQQRSSFEIKPTLGLKKKKSLPGMIQVFGSRKIQNVI